MAESLKKRTGELTRAREEIAQKAAQLQRLLAMIVRIQEEERGRIAHDMHDGLIQLMAGALFESQAARERLPSDPQTAVEKLAVVQKLLGQMEEEVRRTIHDLHPPLLDLAGLAPAIEKYGYHERNRKADSGSDRGRPPGGPARLAEPVLPFLC
jgi:signal transduction histidine kinase